MPQFLQQSGFILLLLTSFLLPISSERVPFLWMWLGSGSSNGWRCSVTGINGCHGVSRRFEKAVVGRAVDVVEVGRIEWAHGSGEAQKPDLTCSLDHVGGRWFLGLGEE